MIALTACGLGGPDRGSTSSASTAEGDSISATPAPPAGWGDSATLAGADSAALATHVATLKFDTTHGVWDEQRLMVMDGGTRRYGVLARIDPELGSARLSPTEVAAGRIIARVRVISPDPTTGKAAYPTLGIAESVSYLYVQKFPAVSGRAGYWRAYMLGASMRTKRPLEMELLSHPRRYPKLSIARWLWSETDERIWGTCGPDCCSAWQVAGASGPA